MQLSDRGDREFYFTLKLKNLKRSRCTEWWTLGSQCAKYVCFQRHICTFAQCFAVTLKCTFVQTIRTGAGIGNLAKNRDVTKSASSNNGNLLCCSTFVEQIAEHRCWILAKKHYSTESLKKLYCPNISS